MGANKPTATPIEEITIPNVLRRNYMLRTYSGEDFQKNEKETSVQKSIAKTNQELIWYKPRMLREFSALAPIDTAVELRIFDIVLGDDPMNEGIEVENDSQRRKLLANENIGGSYKQYRRQNPVLEEKLMILI
jgi:hypothetical protein